MQEDGHTDGALAFGQVPSVSDALLFVSSSPGMYAVVGAAEQRL